MSAEGNPLLMPSPYRGDRGELVGRYPKDVAVEEFDAAGVPLRRAMKAVRAKCLDCCGYEQDEVRKCVAVHCPLWPMRMGHMPKHLRDAACNTGKLNGEG